MSTMRSRVLLLATAVLLVTGGAAAQAVFSEPDADAAPAPRKRASVAEPDAADAAAAAPPPRRVAAVAADDAAAAVAAPAAPAAAAAPVSAVADAGGSAEEPQGLRPKTQLATKYEPGQKILSDEGLPLVDRYVAGSLVKSVKDSGGNTVCEMVLQGECEVPFGGVEREGGAGRGKRWRCIPESQSRGRRALILFFFSWLAILSIAPRSARDLLCLCAFFPSIPRCRN